MDDFSFNTNFLGRDGFTWWIGQIAPYKDADGNALNSMIDSDESWGAPRYKVRIMGYIIPILRHNWEMKIFLGHW